MPQGTITFHLSQGDPIALWLSMVQAHISHALSGSVSFVATPVDAAKAKHLAWMYWNKVTSYYERL